MRWYSARCARIVEAALDHLAPGSDEDVEDLAVPRAQSGGIHQHQVAQRDWTHDRHLGGDPAAQSEADQVHVAQASLLEEPVIEDGLVRNGGDPVGQLASGRSRGATARAPSRAPPARRGTPASLRGLRCRAGPGTAYRVHRP